MFDKRIKSLEYAVHPSEITEINMLRHEMFGTFIIICWTSAAYIEAVKFYKVDKHVLCKDVPNSAVKFSDMHIVGKKQAIAISGAMEVVRNMPQPVQFHLSVNRCEMDKTNCVSFDSLAFDDVCPMFNGNHLVKAHMGFFSPPLTCPLEIGKYTAKDGVLDMAVFEAFSIGNAHWQAELKVVDGMNETAICVWSEVTIIDKDM